MIERNKNVNVKLSEIEFARLEGKVKETGLNKSDLLRRFINSNDNIVIRYDGDEVVQRVCQVEENLSLVVHECLERCDCLERKFEEARHIPCAPPFRVVLPEVRTDLAQVRYDVLKAKAEADEEIKNHVRI